MRLVTLAVLSLVLTACAHARPARPASQRTFDVTPRCDPRTQPLIVIDGLVQLSPCNAGDSQAFRECELTEPLYVVDGVRSCIIPSRTPGAPSGNASKPMP